MPKPAPLYTEDDVRRMVMALIVKHKTQKALAAHLNVSQQYITQLLNGRVAPGPTILGHLKLRKTMRYTVAA